MLKNKTCHAILKHAGAVPSLLFIPPSRRMILHAFCAMNSNDLLKNFPTKR